MALAFATTPLVAPSSLVAPPSAVAPPATAPGQQAVLPSARALAPALATFAAAAATGAAAAVVAKASSRRAAGARRGRVSTAAFENELGAQAPLGLWDPMGFVKDGDEESFKQYRKAEVKHGRVAMYATMGYIVPEYFRFPGFLSPSLGLKFADVPNGLQAVAKVPAEGWMQWVALCGLYEMVVNEPNKNGEPGNFGKGNLGITGESIADPAKRTRGLNSELANGRLAMMAFWGMFFQDAFTGSAWGDWSLFTDSPLRSGQWDNMPTDPGYNTLPEWDKPKNGFEGLVGDQPPLGLWDPLGFANDGNVEKFKRRREVEIKHGRVSMFATIGYIVPEYFKFPGYLAPSTGLKFADVPNGLKALSVLPKEGIAQFFAFVGFIELSYNKPYGEPGNYGKGLFGLGSLGLSATVSDPEVRDKKLRAEISNGRLAMMAIIGMFFQDGLTGQAWGDWSLYTDSPLRVAQR